MPPPDPDSASIRMPFRIAAGLFALFLLLVAAGALFEQFSARTSGAGERLWLAALAITFGFGARYFGSFAITGRPPARGTRTAWRISFDAAFGLAATWVVGTVMYALVSTSDSPVSTVLIVTMVLVFARAVRRYWEHGRASVRSGGAAQR